MANVTRDLTPLLSTLTYILDMGSRKCGLNCRFEIDPLVALPIMEPKPPKSSVTVKPTAEIDFSQLAEYDAVMFGASRHSFLKKWITGSQSKGFTAVSSTAW